MVVAWLGSESHVQGKARMTVQHPELARRQCASCRKEREAHFFIHYRVDEHGNATEETVEVCSSCRRTGGDARTDTQYLRCVGRSCDKLKRKKGHNRLVRPFHRHIDQFHSPNYRIPLGYPKNIRWCRGCLKRWVSSGFDAWLVPGYTKAKAAHNKDKSAPFLMNPTVLLMQVIHQGWTCPISGLPIGKEEDRVPVPYAIDSRRGLVPGNFVAVRLDTYRCVGKHNLRAMVTTDGRSPFESLRALRSLFVEKYFGSTLAADPWDELMMSPSRDAYIETERLIEFNTLDPTRFIQPKEQRATLPKIRTQCDWCGKTRPTSDFTSGKRTRRQCSECHRRSLRTGAVSEYVSCASCRDGRGFSKSPLNGRPDRSPLRVPVHHFRPALMPALIEKHGLQCKACVKDWKAHKKTPKWQVKAFEEAQRWSRKNELPMPLVHPLALRDLAKMHEDSGWVGADGAMLNLEAPVYLRPITKGKRITPENSILVGDPHWSGLDAEGPVE